MLDDHNTTMKCKLEQTEAKCNMQAKKLVEQEIKNSMHSRNSRATSVNRPINTNPVVRKRNSGSVTKSNGNHSASNVSSRIGHNQTINTKQTSNIAKSHFKDYGGEKVSTRNTQQFKKSAGAGTYRNQISIKTNNPLASRDEASGQSPGTQIEDDQSPAPNLVIVQEELLLQPQRSSKDALNYKMDLNLGGNPEMFDSLMNPDPQVNETMADPQQQDTEVNSEQLHNLAS